MAQLKSLAARPGDDGFCSQNPCGSSQPSTTIVPEDLTPLPGLFEYRAYPEYMQANIRPH